jgi:predicted metalloprotease with PDZ domain
VIELIAALALQSAEPIAYEVRLSGAPGAIEAFSVHMRFPGEEDGETYFRLPTRWAGERELWRGVAGLQADGAGLSATDHPALFQLTHAPGADITVRYQIIQDWPGAPSALTQDNPHRPVVQDAYVHAFGQTVFAILTDEAGRPLDLDLSVSLATDPGLALFTDAVTARDRRSLRQSVVVGGDFQSVIQETASGQVQVAWRGDEASVVARAAEDLAPLMTEIDAFWGGGYPSYLVTLLPIPGSPVASSVGGTGLGDAFAFFASEGAPPQRVASIARHEYLHSWIPGRFGGQARDGQNGVTEAWFTEGFTDFYTWRLGAWTGRLDLDSAVDRLNTVLRNYATSPAAARPASSLTSAEYWTDPDLAQLPYQRGFLVALALDAALRRQSGGAANLDTLMRASLDAETGEASAAQAVMARAEAAFDAAFQSTLNAMLESGAPAIIPGDALPACGEIAGIDEPVFDRGFDPDATAAAGMIVTGVVPGSSAWRGGLRDGMEVLERLEGRAGDPHTDYVVRVRAAPGAAPQLIRWRPAGEDRVRVQALVLHETVDRRACLDQIAGRR